MSNDSNVSIDGEIDAGFTSYWDSDKHGQTVGGTTEDDMGSIETDIWPDEVDREDLTEKQNKSLKKAVKNPKLSVRQIADSLDISTSTVRRALEENASRWYNEKFKNTGKSSQAASKPGCTEPGENQEKIIRMINQRDGVSRKELATELGIGTGTVREHIEKIDKSKYEVDVNVDGYHHRAKVYYPPDGSETSKQEQENTSTEDGGSRAPPRATLATKSITGSDYYYWQWRQDGKVKSKYIGPVDKVDPDTLGKDGADDEATEWTQEADDKRVDQHDSQESETQETDVQEILGALKKTAVHQETKQALDVLEGYL